MSHTPERHAADDPSTSPTEYRRVAYATMVGTTIEWYDFFIYAQIAALLFGKLFFSGLGSGASSRRSRRSG